ncbi:hypothetical protein ACQYAD_08495 [Neobacillus sp. SM06]|uniref:hypothetical protein n=1 Tax=Neobacillus sp. SM06 TaxID=3422492 RepID=UPI003D27825F
MELSLERSEIAILVLHMNIMRKPIKKGFKSNYGLKEGRRLIKEYDSLKLQLEDKINQEEETQIFIWNENEINMLRSFLNWYVLEISSSAETQGANIENDEQFKILTGIHNKVNRTVEMAEFIK